MTRLISELCYHEYGQMKTAGVKYVNTIDYLNHSRRRSANAPKIKNFA